MYSAGIIFVTLSFSPLLPHSVPPIVVPLAPDQEVIGNETGNATLSFRIDSAAPPVLLQDLRWFYAANFSSDPSVRQEITNLTNRTTNSTLTFSDFLNMRYINLTVSNIAQRRRGIGGETDEGRYFLVATNPAGVSSSYIDLVLFGMYIMYVHISSWDAILCTYVRMNVCMCVCMYVCMCVCVYVICMYVCMCVCVYVCYVICMYVCMYVCMYLCVCACMYIRMQYVCMMY